MAMLTLFAALGISFVFYADAVAVAAQANRASLAKDQADIDPDLLHAYFLNQMIYGADPVANPYSSMLGHSLAETIYGYNPGYSAGNWQPTLNFAPYNGSGRQSYMHSAAAGTAAGFDNAKMPNYTKFENAGGVLADNFQRRPGFADVVGQPNHRYIEGANVPWTAPDRHSLFLSVVAADGTVLARSFDRPWIAGAGPVPVPMQKYTTLRPHTSWHPQFLTPDSDLGGDVRNIDYGPGFMGPGGVYYNNDSIWMDLGFPIMTAPDGRRYRPLFAPLVMDLSNRLHLWLHGNNIGTGGAHVSGQGWGVSEVNAGKVLTNPTDLAWLHTRRGAAAGAPLGLPNYGPTYARVDLDSVDAGGAAITPFTFPTNPPAAGKFFPFPVFPATGWDNAATEAIVGKPLGRNLMLPANSPIPMMNMEWLLRFRGTNSPATTSELAQRMPQSFMDAANNYRTRNMLTLRSAHLDRINTSPVIPFDPYAVVPQYTFPGPLPLYPKLLAPIVAPMYNDSTVTMSPNSEYNPQDWRSELGKKLRINLNRTLARYPDLDNTTGLITNYGAYDAAVSERVRMATEIYEALVRVTAAQDPNFPSAPATAKDPTTPGHKAARWLAQLAVNIVDYVDEDDYPTPFQWDRTVVDPTDKNAWVFGTELPRLLLNEIYAQYDNEATTPVAPMAKLNVWVELHNPFQATPSANISAYPRDQGRAELVRNGRPVYEVVVCSPEVAATPTKLRDYNNYLGEPDPTIVLSKVVDWGAAVPTQQVHPAGGNYDETSANKNIGFYVVGPTADLIAARNPTFPTTFLTPNAAGTGLSITVPHPGATPAGVTVLLRRLANPHMPANPTPGLQYNPFITIDYQENVRSWDNRENDATGPLATANPPVTDRRSFGRKQPYAGHTSQVMPQDPTPVVATQAKHTFFRHNAREATAAAVNTTPGVATLTFPFDWLTHLDRPLVNPLELLHVSGFKQHELTQQFITVPPAPIGKHQHYAPWGDQDAMIYRVLDLLTTPNQQAGTINGGMHQGKINLNTLTEEEIFQALCDAQAGGLFTPVEVQQIFKDLLAARNPSVAAGATVPQLLQPIDDGKPFKTFGASQLADTWSRKNPLTHPTAPDQPVFGLPTQTHPYQRAALMQKIYNNITNTSNVFGVWLTVGYFEVVDETVRPARLGAEIGRSENRHIRHRFFSIVDRSALKLYDAAVTPGSVSGQPFHTFNPASVKTNTTPLGAAPWNNTQAYALSNAVTSGGSAYICVQANTNKDPATNPMFWQPALQPGMIMEVETPGSANYEAVVVKSVLAAPPGSFTADFLLPHGANAPVMIRGNPGPQATYNPNRDSNVVLHMNTIR